MIQMVITSEVDRVTGKKFKSKHTLDAEEALMGVLATDHAATTNGLKNAFYSYLHNILTEITLKGTLDDLFTKNLER